MEGMVRKYIWPILEWIVTKVNIIYFNFLLTSEPWKGLFILYPNTKLVKEFCLQLNKFFSYLKILGFINLTEFGLRLNLTHADKYPLELCFTAKAFVCNKKPQEWLKNLIVYLSKVQAFSPRCNYLIMTFSFY